MPRDKRASTPEGATSFAVTGKWILTDRRSAGRAKCCLGSQPNKNREEDRPTMKMTKAIGAFALLMATTGAIPVLAEDTTIHVMSWEPMQVDGTEWWDKI